MTQTVVAEQSRSSAGVDDVDAWFVLGPTGELAMEMTPSFAASGV